MKDITTILSALKQPPPEFRPVAFWFLNHYAEEPEVRRQIREIAEKGFGGIMLHARDGLLGGYLDSHWESVVRWSIDEAKKNGLYVYLYDELNYPSGPAGGKVFEKFPNSAMGFLLLSTDCEVKTGECFQPMLKEGQPEKFLVLLPSGKTRKIRPGWKNATRSAARVFGFTKEYMRSYPDVLNKKHAREFIRLSYSWYAKRFRKEFGKTILGEFTDNSCANFGNYRCSIPWTENLPKRFKNFSGLELEKILPSLFTETTEFHLHRLLFWRFINELYLETFIRPIQSECDRNGIAATGHYCIEDGLSEHIRQLGNRFDQKLHQHIPGVDMLGSSDFDKLAELVHDKAHPLAIPMTASCAYFFHGSRVLCESFGLSGAWRMTLAELRRIGGYILALGADLIVPHGIYYSIAGHRKRECVPDFFHNPMWEFFDRWTLWNGRIASLTACSQHIAETAIFYPVSAQQASIELGDPSYLRHGEVCDKIDLSFRTAAELLLKNAVPYEIIDENLLERSRICGDEMILPLPDGTEHFLRTLILPSAWIVGKKAFDKLKHFSHSGGLLIILNDPVSAVFDQHEIRAVKADLLSFRQFEFHEQPMLEKSELIATVCANLRRSAITIRNSQEKLILREWEKAGTRYALIHNFTRDRIPSVQIHCSFKHGITEIKLDEVSGEGIEANENQTFCRDFQYGETLLLADIKSPVNKAKPVKLIHTQEIRGPWHVELEGPNALRITEYRCVAKNKRHWLYEFNMAEISGNVGIALDLDPSPAELRRGIFPFLVRKYNCQAMARVECLVNGNLVDGISFGQDFDRWIYQGDISKFVKKGYNAVELIQSDSDYDGNSVPDPIMITGHFGIQNGMIVPAPETLPSLRWDTTTLADYSGAIWFRKTLRLEKSSLGRELLLSLGKVREIAQVFIDGNLCGTRFMPPFDFKLPPMKKNGFELGIRVMNTPFNRWNNPCLSGIENDVIILKTLK